MPQVDMLSNLESILRMSADDDDPGLAWDLYANSLVARVSAATVTRHNNPEEALAAARQLLADLVSFGYELRTGVVGSSTEDGTEWRGRLIDVVLGLQTDASFGN